MDSDRRRSWIVTLTLLGLWGTVMAAPLLPQGKSIRRNLYGTREDCERDYAPSQCEATGGGGGAGAGIGSGSWRGPGYYADRTLPEARSDPGAGRSGVIRPVETSVRGGFGRFGSVMRAIG
jgi:hypothetical protein